MPWVRCSSADVTKGRSARKRPRLHAAPAIKSRPSGFLPVFHGNRQITEQSKFLDHVQTFQSMIAQHSKNGMKTKNPNMVRPLAEGVCLNRTTERWEKEQWNKGKKLYSLGLKACGAGKTKVASLLHWGRYKKVKVWGNYRMTEVPNYGKVGKRNNGMKRNGLSFKAWGACHQCGCW